MKCKDYMSVSACCKSELDVTKNGRVKCSKCNKFCKMLNCKEDHPSINEIMDSPAFEEEDEGFTHEVPESAIVIAMLGLIVTIIIMLALHYHNN